ncbi:MAG: cupin domain-containing protein [Cryobacterium sp.]|nr:cupin domain-containing protein [Micrococcales bacterium]MBX3309117.1 cupin domain-containing protein [Cryobacterium sp.]
MSGQNRDFSEGAEVNAVELELLHSPVPAEQVLEGAPTVSAAVLGEFEGREVGVWELTPGTVTDVEADELFVVVSGAATVNFLDEDRLEHLAPGSVMQLKAGQRTVWTVTETLRKVYIA